METKFKGILFDLDGTLADTQMDLADSMNRVLNRHNYPVHGYEAYKYMVGKGLKILVRNALPTTERNDKTINICLKELIADYSKNCLNKTTLYKGIPELLRELNVLNIPLVVFTNKDHDLAMIVCNALLKNYSFKTILGRTDDRPRKPDPAGALLLAARLNISPGELLYIGDTDNDMICAKRAGMPSVGVLWGFREREELEANGAKFIVKEPAEILEIVKGN